MHDPATGHPFYFQGTPAVTGKKHAMYLLYLPYGTMNFNHYISHFKIAKEENVGMEIALEPTQGLHTIKDDAYLHNFAKEAKESGIPIFLRFANEMNDPGNPWGKNPKLYIEKFRLVAKVMHAKAPDRRPSLLYYLYNHDGEYVTFKSEKQ